MQKREREMTPLTKSQRTAIKRVFDRQRTYGQQNSWRPSALSEPPNSYRRFRASVRPMLGGGGAVMLPWGDMWLAVEPDGHTHT